MATRVEDGASTVPRMPRTPRATNMKTRRLSY